MNSKRLSRLSFISLSLCLLFLCAGCRKENPDILSQGVMEDLLYDYHMADGIVKSQNLDSLQALPYVNDVYRKYGINQHVFDENMEYYLRHADVLKDIYTRIADRIANEARRQGVDDFGAFLAVGNSTDTINVWKKDRFYAMRSLPPGDLVSETINCDTLYRPGDRILFSLRSDFLYQDGSRNGLMVLSVTFSNDSVYTRSCSMMSSNLYSVDIADNSNLGIKRIQCYIMDRQSNNPSERVSSTMRLMIVSDIKLIVIHKQEQQDNEKEKTDSLPGSAGALQPQQPRQP